MHRKKRGPGRPPKNSTKVKPKLVSFAGLAATPFTIDKGIPIAGRGINDPFIRNSMATLDMLEVGESFLVPKDRSNTIAHIISKYHEARGGKAFTTKTWGTDKRRVWRVA